MNRAPDQRYPLRCPVCGTAMVGEKRTDGRGWARHSCLNCGAIVELDGGDEDEDAGRGAGD